MTEPWRQLIEHYRPLLNMFCATGDGGGVDPSCGAGGIGGEHAPHVAELKRMNDANDVENWTFAKVNDLVGKLAEMKGKDLKAAVVHIYGDKRGDTMARGSKKDIVARVKDELHNRIGSYETGKVIERIFDKSGGGDA